jgi:hypothetical protein
MATRKLKCRPRIGFFSRNGSVANQVLGCAFRARADGGRPNGTPELFLPDNRASGAVATFFCAAYRENTRKPMVRWDRLRVRAAGCPLAVAGCSSQLAPHFFFYVAAATTPGVEFGGAFYPWQRSNHGTV